MIESFEDMDLNRVRVYPSGFKQFNKSYVFYCTLQGKVDVTIKLVIRNVIMAALTPGSIPI